MKPQLLASLIGLVALTPLPPTYAAETEVSPASQALTTIPTLDAPRYMGAWFEIAKYPNKFQKQCIGNAKADYTLLSDGRVKVVNRCRIAGGETAEITGTARQVGASTSPKFEVRFAPAWLSFIPAVWGDYWVIELDDNYQLAAVSEPKREFLWILSRSPKVDAASYTALLGKLRLKGFDTQKLELTSQD